MSSPQQPLDLGARRFGVRHAGGQGMSGQGVREGRRGSSGVLPSSIRARLFGAFAVVVALTLAAGAVSFWSFSNVDQSVIAVADADLPKIETALRMSADNVQIAAAAPTLAAARDATQLAEAAEAMNRAFSQVRKKLVGFAEGAEDASAAAKLQLQLDELERTVARIRTGMGRVLASHAAQVSYIEKLKAEHDAILLGLTPLLDDSNFSLIIGIDDAIDDGDDAIRLSVESGVSEVTALLQVESGVNSLVGELRGAAGVADGAQLQPLRERYIAGRARLADSLSRLPDQPSFQAVKAQIEAAFPVLHDGENDLFLLRLRELEARASVDARLAESRALAGELRLTLESVVTTAQGNMAGGIERVRRAIDAGRFWLIAISVVSVTAAALIAWFYVGHGIVRRMRVLTATMRQIADGALSTPVAVSGRDEIAEMARTLLVFREDLNEANAAREQAARDRKTATEQREQEMALLAERFESSVKHIVDSLGASASDMHKTARSMTGLADDTSQKAVIVASTTEESNASMAAVAASAHQLSDSITSIDGQMKEAAEIARRAVDQSVATSRNVETMVTAAQEIGDVVSLIQEIAEQTNLLALNATIEAARAGKAGVGFAVVASEVKSLASQTAAATQDIARRINGIQDATDKTSSAIDVIEQTIRQLDAIAVSASSSVQQQKEATEEISHNVQATAEGAGEVARTISLVADAAQQSGASAEAVLHASEALSENASSLADEVDSFLQTVRRA